MIWLAKITAVLYYHLKIIVSYSYTKTSMALSNRGKLESVILLISSLTWHSKGRGRMYVDSPIVNGNFLFFQR